MDILQQAPLTAVFSKTGLAAGTTSTITTGGTVVYAIRGKMYSKTALTNQASPTVDSNTGLGFPPLVANQGTTVAILFDVSGNLKAVQGSIVALDTSGNFVQIPFFPTIPDNMVPIGYITLKAGSTLVGTFTFGTSNLSAVTGMTYAFQDLCTQPDRPQIS